MKRYSALVLILLISCSRQAPLPFLPTPTRPTAALAIRTPTASPTSSPTPSATPTPSPSSTTSPTATPALPTDTPTATLTPPLTDLTLCNQEFGPPDIARFSARLERVEVRQLSALDQLTFFFSDLKGDLHGTAGCLRRAQWEHALRTTAAGDHMLAINLSDWGHDQAFAASAISDTLPLTVTGALTGLTFVPTQQASRGLTIGIGLHQSLPYHVEVGAHPDRLIVAVARNLSTGATSDPLGQARGEINPPDSPLFFLQNNDVWRWWRGQAAPVVKTDELETDLVVSPDHETLAVCRAPADTDPAVLSYNTRATLWVLRADGSEGRELADVGGCTDLAFARDGKTLAFAVNTATMPPAKLSVWTVPLVVGAPVQVTATDDEWSRYAPQWLSDGRLIYRARNAGGQTVIFVRDNDGQEREVTSKLLTGPKYSGVGEFVVNGEDNMLAVEAFRNDKPGTDLVFLGLDGTELAPADGRGYWQRPLVWTPSGLVYITTECSSAVSQRYTLRRHRGSNSEDLLSGESTAGLGAVTLFDAELLYTRVASPQDGNRGPQADAEANTPAALWFMTSDGSRRRQLYAAPVDVSDIQGR
ncbi:MAG: hypothetical protein H0X37_09165 [Herpetosiphonaceae bacterium]|nr:hypothetical protein [Herpetosiphonaceae bacterium]